MEQFKSFQSAVDEARLDDAVRATTFLRNVLAPVPAFRESLAAVRTPTELIAEPFDRFLALMPPPAQPSPADPSISFTAEAAGTDAAAAVVALFPTIEAPPVLVAADATSLRRLDGSAIGHGRFRLVAAGLQRPPSSSAVATLDWNHDFRTDLVMAGPGGVRLLLQDENGIVRRCDGQSVRRRASHRRCVRCVGRLTSRWTAISISSSAPTAGAPFVLRNNGDGTWRRSSRSRRLTAVRGFAWADLDRDADPDAVFVDAAGSAARLHESPGWPVRRRRPRYREPQASSPRRLADIDADGAIDVVALESSGIVRKTSRADDDVDRRRGRAWSGFAGGQPGADRLLAADLDNNGALDLIASVAVRIARLAGESEPSARSAADVAGRARSSPRSIAMATAASISLRIAMGRPRVADGRWRNGGLSLEGDPAARAGRTPAISGSTRLASAARSGAFRAAGADAGA